MMHNLMQRKAKRLESKFPYRRPKLRVMSNMIHDIFTVQKITHERNVKWNISVVKMQNTIEFLWNYIFKIEIKLNIFSVKNKEIYCKNRYNFFRKNEKVEIPY